MQQPHAAAPVCATSAAQCLTHQAHHSCSPGFPVAAAAAAA